MSKNEISIPLDLDIFKIFDSAPEGIMITDINGTIIIANKAFCRLTGYDKEEVLGKNPRFMKSGLQNEDYYKNMWEILLNKGEWNGEVMNRHKSGNIFVEKLSISSIKNDSGDVIYYIAQISDITKQYHKEKHYEHIAHHDPLTGLANRILFNDHLHKTIKKVKNENGFFSVACIDIDDFKPINDKYGHSFGDKLLKQIALRLKKAVRDNDLVARLGGDEFVIIMEDIQGCNLVFQRLKEILCNPYSIDQKLVEISASMGISCFPQNENIDADHLVRQADQAMYQSKLIGKNQYTFYDSNNACKIKEQARKLKSIEQALHNKEFVLYYQPKVNMCSGTIIGAEVLIRWKHPIKGILPPSEFLPLIAEHTLSKEIDLWVIRQALDQISSWSKDGIDYQLSVNIGRTLIEDKSFFDDLELMIKQTPYYKKGLLELEILESSALDNVNRVANIINSCQDLGVDFALDDFGTGYSSLNYLKLLPLNNLKIDQSFIRNMIDDFTDQSIIRTIKELASTFKINLIAEGIESVEHGKILLDIGCEHGQGYAISKPMRYDMFLDWAKMWKPYNEWK